MIFSSVFFTYFYSVENFSIKFFTWSRYAYVAMFGVDATQVVVLGS